jgi:hypothetical protein
MYIPCHQWCRRWPLVSVTLAWRHAKHASYMPRIQSCMQGVMHEINVPSCLGFSFACMESCFMYTLQRAWQVDCLGSPGSPGNPGNPGSAQVMWDLHNWGDTACVSILTPSPDSVLCQCCIAPKTCSLCVLLQGWWGTSQNLLCVFYCRADEVQARTCSLCVLLQGWWGTSQNWRWKHWSRTTAFWTRQSGPTLGTPLSKREVSLPRMLQELEGIAQNKHPGSVRVYCSCAQIVSLRAISRTYYDLLRHAKDVNG